MNDKMSAGDAPGKCQQPLMNTSNDVHGASKQVRLGGARADAGVDHRQKRQASGSAVDSP